MNLTIRRTQQSRSYDEPFTVGSTSAVTLLAALYKIKSSLDPSLTFDAGCRSGVCGSCAVHVNGKEELACSYKYSDGDTIEPLRYHPVLRDLKVDKNKAHTALKSVLPNIDPYDEYSRIKTTKDENRTKVQTDCILCNSCYSSCPVLAVNPDFLGPFALTRAWRYVVDDKAEGQRRHEKGQTRGSAPTILENIQKNGIWDCTLCGECTVACPQGIDPKTDIMMLRGESGKAGYTDPNFAAISFDSDFGIPDFGGGFDPNSGFG